MSLSKAVQEVRTFQTTWPRGMADRDLQSHSARPIASKYIQARAFPRPRDANPPPTMLKIPAEKPIQEEETYRTRYEAESEQDVTPDRPPGMSSVARGLLGLCWSARALHGVTSRHQPDGRVSR